MEYRRLGNSGLDVSVVCLGTMMFGDRTGADDASAIVAHAFENGINFIDTADVYAGGASERITGDWPVSIRHTLDRCHPSSAASSSAVIPAPSRSARSWRPNWRRGIADPISVIATSGGVQRRVRS